MLRHIVLFDFLPEAGPDRRAALIAAFRGLKATIPQLQAIEDGLNNSPEGLDQGFTHGFLLTFGNEGDRDAYLRHPAHLAFVEQVRPALAKALVFDFSVSN